MTVALEKAGSGSVEPEDFNAVVDAVNAHGGSLPDWWTVDSTPGAEIATLAGELVVAPSFSEIDPDGSALTVIGPAGSNAFDSLLLWVRDDVGDVMKVYTGETFISLGNAVTQRPIHFLNYGETNSGGVTFLYTGAMDVHLAHSLGGAFSVRSGDTVLARFLEDGGTGKIGFFNTAEVTQRTGVAVTAAAIHAALVSYGLITA